MLSELWRPLLVLSAFLAIRVVILILLFGGNGDDEPYVTPEVATPTATVSPEELDGAPEKKSPEAESVSGKDLKVGDCLAGATTVAGVVKSFDKIDCDKRHDGEVFTIIKLKGDRFPGTKVVSGKGQRGCRARLRRQAAAAEFAKRRLGFKFVYPTRQSWGEGHREVTCFATFKKPRKTKLKQRANARS
jgi:hypothetical protein